VQSLELQKNTNMAKNEFKNIEVDETITEKPKPSKAKESRLGISLRTIYHLEFILHF
jgi:hypothetical protein